MINLRKFKAHHMQMFDITDSNGAYVKTHHPKDLKEVYIIFRSIEKTCNVGYSDTDILYTSELSENGKQILKPFYNNFKDNDTFYIRKLGLPKGFDVTFETQQILNALHQIDNDCFFVITNKINMNDYDSKMQKLRETNISAENIATLEMMGLTRYTCNHSKIDKFYKDKGLDEAVYKWNLVFPTLNDFGLKVEDLFEEAMITVRYLNDRYYKLFNFGYDSFQGDYKSHGPAVFEEVKRTVIDKDYKSPFFSRMAELEGVSCEVIAMRKYNLYKKHMMKLYSIDSSKEEGNKVIETFKNIDDIMNYSFYDHYNGKITEIDNLPDISASEKREEYISEFITLKHLSNDIDKLSPEQEVPLSIEDLTSLNHTSINPASEVRTPWQRYRSSSEEASKDGYNSLNNYYEVTIDLSGSNDSHVSDLT